LFSSCLALRDGEGIRKSRRPRDLHLNTVSGVTCPIPPLPRLLLPSSACSCLSITPANVWSVSLFVFAFTGAHMGNSKLTQITA
jgi:hypothetical protein